MKSELFPIAAIIAVAVFGPILDTVKLEDILCQVDTEYVYFHC